MKIIFPSKYLPTFNCNPIELNFHRIPGLAEKFVYFNDDMFLLRPVEPEIFFKNGLPRDCCIETAIAQDDIRNPFAHILLNDMALVNMHYKKRKVIKKKFQKVVSSFLWKHAVEKHSYDSLSGVFRV